MDTGYMASEEICIHLVAMAHDWGIGGTKGILLFCFFPVIDCPLYSFVSNKRR